MLIFCVHSAIQSVKDGHNTLDVMFKKLAWSFNALWEGDHPELDWNDNPMPPGSKQGPLADGFFACVWILLRLVSFNKLESCLYRLDFEK